MAADYRFEKGQAYWGTSTVDHHYKRIFVVTARRGQRVSFAHVNDVTRQMISDCGGTEYVHIKPRDGGTFTLSARVPVDIDQAFEVVKACRMI